MAFQQQGGGGGMNGGHHGDHHAPQGTEYTLQGVMRFLQIEWHNHERARNSWDIERAEMRAKIAKQEGECKHAKRVNEQLDRQVRMLELALKKERERNKAGNGRPAKPEAAKESVGRSKKSSDGEVKHPAAREASLTDPDAVPSEETAREQYVDNTTKYLKKCMNEIQYLLTPPQHPPPSQLLANGYSALPDAPSLEDIYARNQQQRNQRQQHVQSLPQSSAVPNHQPPPIPNSLPQVSGQQQQQQESDRARYADIKTKPLQTDSEAHRPTQNASATYEDHVESVTHTFDSHGRQIPSPAVDAPQGVRQTRQLPETDGWTFDDDVPPQTENPPPETPMPRRPDTDLFPSASSIPKSPPRTSPAQHRRKSSGSQAMARRRSSQGKTDHDSADAAAASDPSQFKVIFALRGHLDVVRSVIFTGGGSPSEPEICTAGDDSTVKRWIIPASYQNYNAPHNANDLDIEPKFTHRGHEGIVTSLAACPALPGFSTGGRAPGDGWIFSGGQDATVRVWERGRVDPKATLVGHTDAVWSVCVLPTTLGHIFGQNSTFGPPDRLLLVSGSADGTVKVWAISAPPQIASPSTGSRRGVGGTRRHSTSSGSNFPQSPQPSVASGTPFSYQLVHSIERAPTGGEEEKRPSPTSICPLSPSGETFVVSYTDSSVLVFDTRSGEELVGMASNETYDGTMNTSINAVVATGVGLEGSGNSALDAANEEVGAGATGGREGIEGVVISGHEDRHVRFFDANSGQCTYNMLAHPSAISALSLSKDGREAVSAGHDASIRFWSLEKRICTQDIVSHRAIRGEGVCDVEWSQDGRLVVSAGGDGVVKVFAR